MTVTWRAPQTLIGVLSVLSVKIDMMSNANENAYTIFNFKDRPTVITNSFQNSKLRSSLLQFIGS
jgi:hypothetical protein